MTRLLKSSPAPTDVDDVPSQTVNESIGFLLNETARLTRRILFDRLATVGIRGGSWYALRVLWESEALTQRELAESLGMSQPSTLETLRAMERDELVTLERDSLDKRKTRVYLTARARDLRVPLLRLAEETTNVVVQRLSPPEQVALRMLLRIVRDTTSDALKGQPMADTEPEIPARSKKK